MAIDPERANRWNEPRRAGLHLRSSPRRSWRVRRATLVHVQHAVRFKPGEIQSALPCFVGLPFASGEAIRRLRSRACHDPDDPHSA